jgi:hypothetical protein
VKRWTDEAGSERKFAVRAEGVQIAVFGSEMEAFEAARNLRAGDTELLVTVGIWMPRLGLSFRIRGRSRS